MYHWDGDITNIPKDLYDAWASAPGVKQPDDYSVDMKGRPILVGFPYDWQPGMAEQEYINNKPTHVFGQPSNQWKEGWSGPNYTLNKSNVTPNIRGY